MQSNEKIIDFKKMIQEQLEKIWLVEKDFLHDTLKYKL